MSDKKKIGLIGAGLMGHGIGKNVIDKGYPLSVMAHTNREPIDDLVERGATEAASAAEIARGCDIVILCVTGTPQVEDTLYRDDGLLEGVRDGLIVVDCTTANPVSTLKVAADIQAKGGRYMDAPLTMTPKEAETGNLGMILGGDKSLIDEVMPILETFADNFNYAGELGAGHKLKLINNFIALGTATLVSEAIATAAKAEVDMQALYNVVSTSGADSVMFRRIMTLALEDDDTGLMFYLQNAKKDVSYYVDLAHSLSSTGFIAGATYETLTLANNLGHGDKFVSRLIDMFGDINGIKVRK